MQGGPEKGHGFTGCGKGADFGQKTRRIITAENSSFPEPHFALRETLCVFAHAALALQNRVRHRIDGGILRVWPRFAGSGGELMRKVLKIKKGGWGVLFFR
jgi:hypothetical protein